MIIVIIIITSSTTMVECSVIEAVSRRLTGITHTHISTGAAIHNCDVFELLVDIVPSCDAEWLGKWERPYRTIERELPDESSATAAFSPAIE
jgi:hypothetical protein